MLKKVFNDILEYRKLSNWYLDIITRHESFLYYSLRVLSSGYNLESVHIIFLCEQLEEQANDIAHAEYVLANLSPNAFLTYFLGQRIAFIRKELDWLTKDSRTYYKSLKQGDLASFTKAIL